MKSSGRCLENSGFFPLVDLKFEGVHPESKQEGKEGGRGRGEEGEGKRGGEGGGGGREEEEEEEGGGGRRGKGGVNIRANKKYPLTFTWRNPGT